MTKSKKQKLQSQPFTNECQNEIKLILAVPEFMVENRIAPTYSFSIMNSNHRKMRQKKCWTSIWF